MVLVHGLCCFYLKSLGFSDRQSSYLQFSLKGSRIVLSFVKAVIEYSLGVDYPHYWSRAHLGFLLNVCKQSTRALSSGWWKKIKWFHSCRSSGFHSAHNFPVTQFSKFLELSSDGLISPYSEKYIEIHVQICGALFLYNFLLSRILLCNVQLLQSPWPLISISPTQ